MKSAAAGAARSVEPLAQTSVRPAVERADDRRMQVFPTEERLADYAERAIGLFSPQERVRAAGGVAVSMLAAAIPPTVAVLAVWALATAWRDGGG